MTVERNDALGGLTPPQRHLPLRRTKRRAIGISAMLLAAAALAACSSGAPSAGTSASVGVQSLRIGINSPGPVYAQAYLAAQEGYDKKEGVNVTIVNAGSNALNLLVANQVDLIIVGVGSALLPVKDGKSTSFIYATLGNGVTGMIAGRKGITSLSQIKRMGTGGIGTSTYGYASYYKQKLGLNYDIVPFQDNASMSASLVGGSIDGAVNSASVLLPLVNQGVKILVDPRDPAVRAKYIAGSFPESGVIASDTSKNTIAIQRFMDAMKLSQQYLASHSAKQIAAELHKVPDLQSIATDSLVTQVEATLPSYAPNKGEVTKSIWNLALSQYAFWGLGLDLTDARYSFKERVDMSFYDDAHK